MATNIQWYRISGYTWNSDGDVPTYQERMLTGASGAEAQERYRELAWAHDYAHCCVQSAVAIEPVNEARELGKLAWPA